jgi:hypothetical protein
MVMDSAGVEIVTVSIVDELESLRSDVATVPQLDLGVADSTDEQVLSGVVGAVRLSDGRVVVANGGTRELRVFDPDGELSDRVGRTGEGPGEFRSIGFLGVLRGDSILVYDGRLHRTSVFDADGTFITTVRVADAMLPYMVGVLNEAVLGAWYFIGQDDDRLGIVSAPVHVGMIDIRDGRFHAVDTVASGEESRVHYRGQVTRAFRPFGREADVAAGGNALYILESSDDRSIRQYDSRGELKRILRIDVPRSAVDAGAIEEWTKSWMTRFSPGSVEVEEWWRHGFRETSSPDQIPVFRSLEVDADGNVCAERYPITWTAASSYWCFSPEGIPIRSIQLPAGLLRQGPHPFTDAQLEIGRDYVLGVWQDSLDVQHVRMYRFR